MDYKQGFEGQGESTEVCSSAVQAWQASPKVQCTARQ